MLIPSIILPSFLNWLSPSLVTGIFIGGDAGGNSLFGGHDNMVGKRSSSRIPQSIQNLHTLAMITDEAMTSKVYLLSLSAQESY